LQNQHPLIIFGKLKLITMKTSFNKFLYIGFILVGLFQALFSKDYMQAVSSFGIALAFDPFDQEQKWNDRPTWQKAVLFVHLAIVAALFGFAIGLNDK
jgi:mannose/fructose/N-acetylgalactosamine-specific phosphotransferase system component IIC